MIIRQYTEEDFEGIKRVIQNVQTTECWPICYPHGWDCERIRKEFNPVKDYRDPLFLISEEEDKITGLIAGHDLASFTDNEAPHLKGLFEKGIDIRKTFYQRDLIVHPNWQRGFLGLRLFKKMEEHAQEKGYNFLVTRTPLLNSRGIRFFRGLGYEDIFMDTKPERVYFAKKI